MLQSTPPTPDKTISIKRGLHINAHGIASILMRMGFQSKFCAVSHASCLEARHLTTQRVPVMTSYQLIRERNFHDRNHPNNSNNNRKTVMPLLVCLRAGLSKPQRHKVVQKMRRENDEKKVYRILRSRPVRVAGFLVLPQRQNLHHGLSCVFFFFRCSCCSN